MVQILERVQAHYESRELPFGKVYEWHPAAVALECDCGEKVTLSASSTTTTCGRCGADLGTFVYEIDEQWERVRALLPRQKPGQGRPRLNDRQVLGGILWVMDTGSSWRDLPEEEFGPNSTAHGRYRKWCKEGLWPRIVEVLGR